MAHAIRVILLLKEEEERRKERAQLWNKTITKRRSLRMKNNLMDLGDRKFKKMFRVSKDLANEVIERIGPKLPRCKRIDGITPQRKILATLHLLGAGGFQATAGSNASLQMSQATISRCLRDVVPVIASELANEIHFPSTMAERERIAMGFRRLAPFEGVIGSLDCTHILLNRQQQQPWDFVHPKGCTSLNAQMICDANRNFLYVEANFPGEVDDQFIWSGSAAYNKMEMLHQNEIEKRFYLLGDSKYCAETFLLTPLHNYSLGSPEEKYTRAHSNARKPIEKAIDILRARWRILRKLTYKPLLAPLIIHCCAILHNMCQRYNIPDPASKDVLDSHVTNTLMNIQEMGSRDALMKRDVIIKKYFCK